MAARTQRHLSHGGVLRSSRRAEASYKTIDMQTCAACGGARRIIACIEDPVVIAAILATGLVPLYEALGGGWQAPALSTLPAGSGPG